MYKNNVCGSPSFFFIYKSLMHLCNANIVLKFTNITLVLNP